MAGNEIETAQFLLLCKGIVDFRHVGIITGISIPHASPKQMVAIKDPTQLTGNLSPDQSNKKADLFINDYGVSIKQAGGNFSFNRLQRANLLNLFSGLGFRDPQSCLERLDHEVAEFHCGKLERRNRPWDSFFSEKEFKRLMEYLMMQGSPNLGDSQYPADYILESGIASADLKKKSIVAIANEKIRLYSFDEYFNEYKEKFKVSIRRSWIGQKSKSEHNRAKSLAKKQDNLPWVFEGASGQPSSGWNPEIPPSQRRTVYYLMIEKVN